MKVLLFGCGKQMTEHLAPVLFCHPEYQPTWCIDRCDEKSNTLARTFGLQAVSLEDISDLPIELVVSAVRPKDTDAAVKIALEKSCPLFLEKPGALSSWHFDQIISSASRESIPIWLGFNYRYSDVADCLMKGLTEKKLSRASYTFFSQHPLFIENDEENLVECWIKNNSIHILDFIAFLHGKIERIDILSKYYDGEKFSVCLAFTTVKKQKIFLYMGNIKSTFEITANLEFVDGTHIISEGFDRVTYQSENFFKLIYKASTFNKIRKKDGFYRQFDMMSGNSCPYSQLRLAQNSMNIAENIYRGIT
jgi:predicted dehydrogenase